MPVAEGQPVTGNMEPIDRRRYSFSLERLRNTIRLASIEERCFSRCAIAILADVDVRHAGMLAVFVVGFFAVEHEDDVCVLLDRARVSKIRENRNRRRALLDQTRKLREGDDRDTEAPWRDS